MQVYQFVKLLDERESFFGYRDETLPSLVLTLLPGGIIDSEKKLQLDPPSAESSSLSIGAFLLYGVTEILQQIGFLPVLVSNGNLRRGCVRNMPCLLLQYW